MPASEPEEEQGRLFAEAVAIMARLRAPGGCPWDREQTFETIQRYTLEETYEVFDAIERRDWRHLKEELGDLLLQVLFYSEMAEESGHFTIAEVVETLNRKLIRRHPHVFGEQASAEAGNVAVLPGGIDGIDAPQVLRNWEQIKAAEKAETDGCVTRSRLAAVPKSLPALMEASKLGSRAAKCGFDWPDMQGLFAKLAEEISELHDALDRERHAGPAVQPEQQREVASELGDLLFTVVNLARHLEVDPESALRGTNAKFRQRFAAMEEASATPIEELSAERLEELWAAAKFAERSHEAANP